MRAERAGVVAGGVVGACGQGPGAVDAEGQRRGGGLPFGPHRELVRHGGIGHRAGVDGGGDHLIAERLAQIDHAETGIEAAREGENTAGKNSHPRVTSVRRKRPQKRLRICLAKAPPLRRARTDDCSEREGGSQRKVTPRVK
jgi:hypothetical protein